MPSGEKYWYCRTREDGRDRKHSPGRYPDTGLKQAHGLRYTFRTTEKAKTVLFSEILDEWFTARLSPSCGEQRRKQTRSVIQRYILPALEQRDLRDITAREIFELLRPLNEKYLTVAQRVRSIISRTFQYAVASGLCEWNPAAQPAGALTPYRTARHFAIITTEAQAVEVLNRTKSYGGNRVIRLALLLLAHTFVRPGEIRPARWAELDFDRAEWRIPAERMKMRREHVVPLSPQVLDLFHQLRQTTTNPVYCFALPLKQTPLSRAMLPYAMRRMGLSGTATPHGFRGMASTLLNEHGFMPDVIERQLAHTERNAVRAAYNRAEYMDERRRMMNWWSDCLDGLME